MSDGGYVGDFVVILSHSTAETSFDFPSEKWVPEVSTQEMRSSTEPRRRICNSGAHVSLERKILDLALERCAIIRSKSREYEIWCTSVSMFLFFFAPSYARMSFNQPRARQMSPLPPSRLYSGRPAVRVFVQGFANSTVTRRSG